MEKLAVYGADIVGIQSRFMGDESFYEECIVTFLSNKHLPELEKNVLTKDYKHARENAHAIKGMAETLGLIPLVEKITKLMVLLRQENPSEIEELYHSFSTEFETFKKAIE